MTRRLISIMAVALVALAGSIMFLRPAHKNTSVQLFELGLTNDGMIFTGGGHSPVFEPQTGQWVVEGRLRPSLKPYLIRSLNPHGLEVFAAVRLPKDASVNVFHRALLALRAEGICRLAVDDEVPKEVLIYRLEWVRADDGKVLPCSDAFEGEVAGASTHPRL